MRKAQILGTGWLGDGDSAGYHGWPTLIRCADGRLLAACSGERLAHVCPCGRVVIYESADNGATWSAGRILTDGPLDDRDAGLIQTPAGTLLINWFTSIAFIDCGPTGHPESTRIHPKAAVWNETEERLTVADIRRHHGFFMKRSTDGGKTWSDKYRVPLNNVHGPSVLDDGSLLWTGRDVSKTSILGGNVNGPRSIVCRSVDDGLTWEEIGEIPPAEGHVPAKYHELHQIQAADGSIICHIRNQNYRSDNEGPTTWQCISTDGGRTWTKPEFVFKGFPSHLLRLKDGRLMASYGMRSRPYGNQVRFSDDCGRTWSEPVIISDDAVSNDLGYTSTAELEDGTFFSLWYEHRPQNDGVALLRYARWK